MQVTFIVLATAIGSLAIGSFLGYLARQTIAKKQLTTAEGKIAKMLEETEKKAQEMTLEAKNKAVAILEEAKAKEKEREDQILRMEQRLEKREVVVDQRMEELERGRSVLERKAEEIRQIYREADEARKKGAKAAGKNCRTFQRSGQENPSPVDGRRK